jgi:hypothetical protein
MKELRDNSYNPKLGVLEGDHQRLLVRFTIGNLVERANVITSMGTSPNLTEDDLPSGVRDLMAESAKLSEQLERCDAVDIETAISYCERQAKFAGKALPLLAAELGRREADAAATVAAIRAQWMGKEKSATATQVVDELLRSTGAADKASHALKLPAFRTATGVVRDIATEKNLPRCLKILAGQHQAYLVSGLEPDYLKVSK